MSKRAHQKGTCECINIQKQMIPLYGYTSLWKAHNGSICEEKELGDIQNVDVGNPYFLDLRIPQRISQPLSPIRDGLI